MEFALNGYQLLLMLISVMIAVCAFALAYKGLPKTAAAFATVWLVMVIYVPIKTVAPSHGDREAPPSFDKAFTAPVPPADTRTLKQQNEDEYEALKAQSKELEHEINR